MTTLFSNSGSAHSSVASHSPPHCRRLSQRRRCSRFGQDVSFDFARLVEYRDVTPAERLERAPHERLIEMKLPISVRFQGLAVGEIEHLDFEIDGTAAGIRVESFSPATELAADAVSVETINKTDQRTLARRDAQRQAARAGRAGVVRRRARRSPPACRSRTKRPKK